MVEQLKELSSKRYVSPYDMAVVHTGLGERDLSFACLENAYRDRMMRLIDPSPAFEPLWADPRFQDLVRRIGLPS